LRIALYSHDTLGLGHLRRNLLIARTFAGSELQANVLTITGAAEAKLFETPAGVDSLTLPALRKHSDGSYESRSLDVSLDELGTIRGMTIRAALAAFRPDVFIVDKVPTGAVGELIPALEDLRERADVRCVLGLRDILDEPGAVQSEWQRLSYVRAIDDFYDAIWVYGDRNVYDVVEHYELPASVAAKIRYTGYFDRSGDAAQASLPFKPGAEPRKYVLCLLGGGQDGNALAESFAGADFPAGVEGVILTGPFLSGPMRELLRRSVSRRPHIHVLDFVSEPAALIQGAEKVVSMGGYNSVCEVLGHGRPLLIVPRVAPRSEQLIRAQRLSALGLVDYLVPEQARPSALSRWIAQTAAPPRQARERLDFRGLQRLPALVSEWTRPAAKAGGCAGR